MTDPIATAYRHAHSGQVRRSVAPLHYPWIPTDDDAPDVSPADAARAAARRHIAETLDAAHAAAAPAKRPRTKRKAEPDA